MDGVLIIRAVSVICVIGIHAVHWPLQNSNIDHSFWSTIDELLRFSVPAFVVLTGILLVYTRQNERPVDDYLRRRLLRSLIPWIVWAPIYCVFGLYLTGEIAHSFQAVESWWLYGTGHLYFLLLVPQFYLLFLLWPRSKRGVIIAAFCGMLLQEIFCIERLFGPLPGNNFLQQLSLDQGYLLFPFWIGYFSVGVAIGHFIGFFGKMRFSVKLAICIAIPISGLIVVLGAPIHAPYATFAHGTGGFLLPLMPTLVFSIIGSCLCFGTYLAEHMRRLFGILVVIANYSLGIYITHEALLYIPGRLLHEWLQLHIPWSIGPTCILVLVALLLGLLVTRLIVATPFAKIVGQQQKPLHLRGDSGPMQ